MPESDAFLEEPPDVRLRHLVATRVFCGAAGAVLVVLFVAAWATHDTAWYVAWLAWFGVMSVAVSAIAGIPRRLQRQLDREWAARFHERSIRDELTGLYNRRHFNDVMDGAVRSGPGTPFALVLLDLNDFKRINDTYGHAAGDAALVHTATVLSNVAPTIATLARTGGDEFAVILPGLDRTSGAKFVRDVEVALKMAPFGVDGTSMRLYAACGMAEWAPGMSAEEVLREADLALYRRKAELGRLRERRAS